MFPAVTKTKRRSKPSLPFFIIEMIAKKNEK
jgi:hypothetical protein